MVNMGNNGKISDVAEIGQGIFTTVKKCERSLAYLRLFRYQTRALLSEARESIKAENRVYIAPELWFDNNGSGNRPTLPVETN